MVGILVYDSNNRLKHMYDGDTEALYARLMRFMLGGLRAPLLAIAAKLTKRPRIRKAA